MSDERPLHVKVAEALGITVLYADDEGYTYIPDPATFKAVPIPRYDTDWSATGPLIERHRISVEYEPEPGYFDWRARTPGFDPFDHGLSCVMPVTGDTPLVAVCNLILLLKEAGKIAG